MLAWFVFCFRCSWPWGWTINRCEAQSVNLYTWFLSGNARLLTLFDISLSYSSRTLALYRQSGTLISGQDIATAIKPASKKSTITVSPARFSQIDLSEWVCEAVWLLFCSIYCTDIALIIQLDSFCVRKFLDIELKNYYEVLFMIWHWQL